MTEPDPFNDRQGAAELVSLFTNADALVLVGEFVRQAEGWRKFLRYEYELMYARYVYTRDLHADRQRRFHEFLDFVRTLRPELRDAVLNYMQEGLAASVAKHESQAQSMKSIIGEFTVTSEEIENIKRKLFGPWE